MFHIKDLSAKTGVTAKTIRYYETMGLLPAPARAPNGYRLYTEADVERLNLIRGARALEFTLEEIAAILAYRDKGEPPCGYVMATIQQRMAALEAHIRVLQRLHRSLESLYEVGQSLPEDVQMQTCVCHLAFRPPVESTRSPI